MNVLAKILLIQECKYVLETRMGQENGVKRVTVMQ